MTVEQHVSDTAPLGTQLLAAAKSGGLPQEAIHPCSRK